MTRYDVYAFSILAAIYATSGKDILATFSVAVAVICAIIAWRR